MAQKTYYQLKYENKHLEMGDKVLIHGVSYKLCNSGSTHNYFLDNPEGENCEVFTKVFDLTVDEKYSWAKRFNSTGLGSFPEFKDIRDLERFVIDIFERPEYKVGDYVTILERKHSPNAYPASFVDDMASQCGKTFQIEHIRVESTPIEDSATLHNGEPNLYSLKGITYSWHPSMFRRATEEEVRVYKGITKSLEVKNFKVLETPSDIQDSELRLPKNTNKTPHINL